MNKVRLGLIGTGGMAKHHIKKYFADLEGVEFTAACDVNQQAVDAVAAEYGVKACYDYKKMLKRAKIDAVMVATPHYFHTPIVISALKKGIHVLTEKPVAVHALDAAKMNKAYEKSQGLVYAAMFQLRTSPVNKKLKQLMDQKILGRLIRVNYIITKWFRSQAYYDSGDWRATWKGEGGGVLLNQCPHNLDLFQWFFGMPARVQSMASLARWHDIEVEDDITAVMEFPDGATGVFVTNTIEGPGTDRMEICGEYGKILVEDGKIMLSKYNESLLEYSRTTDKRMGLPTAETSGVDIPESQAGHKIITQNFINAIRNGEPLIAPATEGYNSVALANAMLMSGLKGRPVEMPLNERKYANLLKKLIQDAEKD